MHTRREWLVKTALAGPAVLRAAAAPSAPVAVARCKTYAAQELLTTLNRMFDQLGGLGRIVKGKTVAIKINLTGSPRQRLKYLMEQSEMTRNELAAVLRCSQPLVSLILSGKRNLSKENIRKLAAHFKLDTGYFL